MNMSDKNVRFETDDYNSHYYDQTNTGLSQRLISIGIAKTPIQANIILIALSALLLIIAVWVIPSLSGKNKVKTTNNINIMNNESVGYPQNKL